MAKLDWTKNTVTRALRDAQRHFRQRPPTPESTKRWEAALSNARKSDALKQLGVDAFNTRQVHRFGSLKTVNRLPPRAK